MAKVKLHKVVCKINMDDYTSGIVWGIIYTVTRKSKWEMDSAKFVDGKLTFPIVTTRRYFRKIQQRIEEFCPCVCEFE